MTEKQIEKVKAVLTEWNPLGEDSIKVEDLNNYHTEAIDILFFINKKCSVDRIDKVMKGIISEAFNINYDLGDTRQFALRIRQIITEK